MNTHLVAIGDVDRIKKIIGGRVFVEEGDTVVFSAPPGDHPALLKELQREDIQACAYSQCKRLMESTVRYIPLREYDSAAVYDWQKTGRVFFAITYSGTFDMCAIDKSDVHVVNKIEPVVGGFLSTTGAIMGFVRGNIVSLHVNDSLDKLLDIKVAEPVEELAFDPSDRYLGMRGEASTYIYDMLTGRELYVCKRQSFYFAGDRVCFHDGELLLESGAFERGVRSSTIKTSGDRIARFVDGKLQQIVFATPRGVQTKNHSSIVKAEFHFSESKLYALITKKIGNEHQYILESYSGEDITINRLESYPTSITVADSSFIVADTQNNLSFYRKERYNFTLVRTIKKEGGAVVSARNGMACVYDSSSQAIEFYDRGVLRSVYSHHGCTSISWSESGLYVAAFACSSASSSLVQIFNCNGKLIYRKTYNKLTAFQWRPFLKMTEEQKAAVGPPPETQDDDVCEAFDVTTLLSEWKGYLLSKIQNIKSNN